MAKESKESKESKDDELGKAEPSQAEAQLGLEMLSCIKRGLQQAVKERLTASYGNPLDKVIASVIDSQMQPLRELILAAVVGAVADEKFRVEIESALRTKLAKTLVERCGGELEKSINTLKSDPATRAKITVAIDGVMQGLLKN